MSGELNCSNSTFDCGMHPVGGHDLPTSCDAAGPRVSVDIDSGKSPVRSIAQPLAAIAASITSGTPTLPWWCAARPTRLAALQRTRRFPSNVPQPSPAS